MIINHLSLLSTGYYTTLKNIILDYSFIEKINGIETNLKFMYICVKKKKNYIIIYLKYCFFNFKYSYK
jgi:hypothetical protein